MQYSGVVKWFNAAKGFGFITSEDFAEDIFVHYSYIEMEGYKALKMNDKVIFIIEQTPNGIHAKSVQLQTEKKDVILEPT